MLVTLLIAGCGDPPEQNSPLLPSDPELFSTVVVRVDRHVLDETPLTVERDAKTQVALDVEFGPPSAPSFDYWFALYAPGDADDEPVVNLWLPPRSTGSGDDLSTAPAAGVRRDSYSGAVPMDVRSGNYELRIIAQKNDLRPKVQRERYIIHESPLTVK